ncbi:MAG: cobalamin-binding protein [Candidatus Margulisbacteria bacterium]|nr:cobalamin-binding protein [Candidatus Margulisiibacteriota bacterium]
MFRKFTAIIIVAFLLAFSNSAIASIAFPQRIVSGIPSVTEILYGIGIQDRVVGVSSTDNFPLEVKKKERIGGLTLNIEKIIALDPDLVILHETAQKLEIPKLRRFNVPIYTVDPRSVGDIIYSIMEIGRITGENVNAANLISAMYERIEAAKARVKDKPKKKVFVLVGYKPIVSVGKDSFINSIIEYAGGINMLAESQNPYPQLSFEQFLYMNPPHIIVLKNLISESEVKSDLRWRQISALKNGKILFIDEDILVRPGPRVVYAIEKIAEFLHE